MASPLCTIDNSPSLDGVNVSASSNITIRLADHAGVTTWVPSIIGSDDGQDMAALNLALNVNSVTKVATLVMPADPCTLIFQSKINNGRNSNGAIDAAMTTTFGVFVVTNNNLRKIAPNQVTEGSSGFGLAKDFNAIIDAFDSVTVSDIQGVTIDIGTDNTNTAVNIGSNQGSLAVGFDEAFIGVTSEMTVESPLMSISANSIDLVNLAQTESISLALGSSLVELNASDPVRLNATGSIELDSTSNIMLDVGTASSLLLRENENAVISLALDADSATNITFAPATTPSIGFTQSASGAGRALTITGQKGASSNIGGAVTIAAGQGATAGTNLGGGINLDLQAPVSNVTSKLSVTKTGTALLEAYQYNAGGVGFYSPTLLLDIFGAGGLQLRGPNPAMSATSGYALISGVTNTFLQGPIVTLTTAAAASKKVTTVANTFTEVYDAAVTSVSTSWTQAASGAGGVFSITGQQGASGQIGGKVAIKSGRGATSGTNAAGGIDLDLGAQAGGTTDWLQVCENGTAFVGFRHVGTTTFMQTLGTSTSLQFNSTNVGFTATSSGVFQVSGGLGMFFDTGTSRIRTGAAATLRTDTQANAFTSVWEDTITSLSDTINKKSGTGANAGASRTIAAQDGQNVAGGTNNSGGNITLTAGAVGTGGTGGANGTVKLRTASTDFLTFSYVSSVPTIAAATGANLAITSTSQVQLSGTSAVQSFTPDYYHNSTTVNYRNASSVGKCAVTIADAFIENFASAVSVDRQANGSSRILTDSNGNKLSGNLRFGSAISPTAIGSNQTGYNPSGLSTATRLRQDVSAACVLNSMRSAGIEDGHQLIIENISNTAANTLTILHDDGATGTAAERFLCPGNANIVIPRNGAVHCEYDLTSARWRVIGKSI